MIRFHSTPKSSFFQCLGPDCKKYSLNNNGPCINGGNLTCNGNELTHEVSCKCPINYQGRFCEEKVEKVFAFKAHYPLTAVQLLCLSFCLSVDPTSVCFVFASYTKEKHYKNVMFDKFETRMLTQNIIINILCSPLYFQVTRICDRIIPTSTSQNLNSCTLTKKECVTYSRNKLYMYKCYETSTFKDKQG